MNAFEAHDDRTPRLFKEVMADDTAHPLVEPSLFYDPPYERQVEDEFAWHLVKYLTPISGLRYQEPVEAASTRLWLDFVVDVGERRVAFEIGELEPDREQERLHDALAVGRGGVDVLYRFRVDDLLRHLHDALHVVARWDPALFSARGRINLHTLASPAVKQVQPQPDASVTRIVYPGEEQTETYGDDVVTRIGPEGDLVVRRLSRRHPAAWMRDCDRALSQFAEPSARFRRRWAKTA